MTGTDTKSSLGFRLLVLLGVRSTVATPVAATASLHARKELVKKKKKKHKSSVHVGLECWHSVFFLYISYNSTQVALNVGFIHYYILFYLIAVCCYCLLSLDCNLLKGITSLPLTTKRTVHALLHQSFPHSKAK